MAPTTIANILEANEITPAPDRPSSWRTFLKAHWPQIAATDFFSAEVWPPRGLTTYFVLFMIDLKTRRAHLARSGHRVRSAPKRAGSVSSPRRARTPVSTTTTQAASRTSSLQFSPASAAAASGEKCRLAGEGVQAAAVAGLRPPLTARPVRSLNNGNDSSAFQVLQRIR